MKVMILFSLLGLLCNLTGLSQTSLDQVEMDHIPYKKVRKYLEDIRNKAHISRFNDLEASCLDIENVSEFRSYSRTYIVKEPLNEVWSTYINASPTSTWKTRKSDVALVYDRSEDHVLYGMEKCDGSKVGQILYLNLNLLKGFYHLATSVEITEINTEENIIELSYMDGGINQGQQFISMSENDKGHTIITHKSMIRSESAFRDKYLYPYFHNKLINAFHHKMKKQVAINSKETEQVISCL